MTFHFTTLRSPSVALLSFIPIFLASCSPQYWSQDADKDVYTLLHNNEVSLFGEAVEFDISTPHSADDPEELRAVEILAERRSKETHKIDLDEAITMAVENGRDYQTEKENLYLVGLDLTRARHDFSPQFDASSGAGLDNTWVDGEHTQNQTSIPTRLGFDQLMRSGGFLALDLAHNIFKFYLGGGAAPPTTFLVAKLNQPLLRGRGKVATESLTQRKRNVAYAIRSFSRYQKRHALDITSDYYRILQEKDRVQNEYFNYRNLIAFTERATELAEDRLPRFQVDQARQDELRARNRYILAVDSYRRLVDQFKLTLGMPVGGELFLDDQVLTALSRTGLTSVPLDESSAIDIAIENRLDLLNQVDQFEDAQRKLVVAADAFKPGLDLFADLSMDSYGGHDYSNFDPEVYRTRLGVDLDLPVDNLDARNSYRRSEISFERQLRELALALDEIQFEVRSGIRGLELARQSYDIQVNALRLANQRVDAVNLLLETDRAETRDLLEARNAQLSARNALTSALISYHLTRLELLFDLGIFDPTLSQFWVRNPEIPQSSRNNSTTDLVSPASPAEGAPLITPEELFQESSL
ncbi:TolC family protein [Haloferula chungangensis]|uniref:TolC family protein n=1 Tax=Haloferula chungangensis TaxID=1048331 RepID=A0ABW2LC29_9BACT